MQPCVLLLTSALTDMQARSTSQPCTSAPFCATPPVSVGAFDSVLVVVIRRHPCPSRSWERRCRFMFECGILCGQCECSGRVMNVCGQDGVAEEMVHAGHTRSQRELSPVLAQHIRERKMRAITHHHVRLQCHESSIPLVASAHVHMPITSDDQPQSTRQASVS